MKAFVFDLDDCLLHTDAIAINGNDYSQFDEVSRIYNAITNMDVIDMIHNRIDYDIICLTARGTEDDTHNAIQSVLHRYGITLSNTYAINDTKYDYIGIHGNSKLIPMKKRYIIEMLKDKYDTIEYIDDSAANVEAMRDSDINATIVKMVV